MNQTIWILLTQRMLFVSLCLLCLSCESNELSAQENSISRIAFGSCNRQDLPQDMWQHVLANQPELWIWLGDNIYGDSDQAAEMEAKYQRQLAHPEYQQLIQNSKVIGTWDDHDYGINDGGNEFPFRETSQDLMLDFLQESEESQRRNTPGIYTSHIFGKDKQQVKVILLDGRYFRDKQEPTGLSGNQQRYKQNTRGTFLGEAQWTWLEEELKNSEAAINLIACGIQIIPEEHPFEKMANFPHERERMFELIKTSGANNVIFLSGDRHIAEFSKMDYEGLAFPLYDLTSSGLTHSYEAVGEEPNKHRITKLIGSRNFGLIEIDWERNNLKASIRGLGNNVYDEILIYLR